MSAFQDLVSNLVSVVQTIGADIKSLRNNKEDKITKSSGFAKWNGSAWGFDNSTYQPASSNLTGWSNKSVPSGNIVDTTTAQTISGTKTYNSSIFSGSLRLTTQAVTVNQSTYTINFATQSLWRIVVASDVTFTLSFPGPGRYTAVVVQDSTGNRSFSFNSTAWLNSATQPEYLKTANGRNVVTFLYDGTSIIGALGKVGA